MLDQRGFPSAIRTQDSDQITTINREIDVLENERCIIAITKIHIFKDHQGFASFRTLGRLRLMGLLSHLAYSFHHPLCWQFHLVMVDLSW
jgi:hypothetical protein